MGLTRFFSRLDRWAARFNDWIGPTAEASHIGSEGFRRRPGADPAAVVGLLGEMEREGKSRNGDPDESPRQRPQTLGLSGDDSLIEHRL